MNVFLRIVKYRIRIIEKCIDEVALISIEFLWNADDCTTIQYNVSFIYKLLNGSASCPENFSDNEFKIL